MNQALHKLNCFNAVGAALAFLTLAGCQVTPAHLREPLHTEVVDMPVKQLYKAMRDPGKCKMGFIHEGEYDSETKSFEVNYYLVMIYARTEAIDHVYGEEVVPGKTKVTIRSVEDGVKNHETAGQAYLRRAKTGTCD